MEILFVLSLSALALAVWSTVKINSAFSLAQRWLDQDALEIKRLQAQLRRLQMFGMDESEQAAALASEFSKAVLEKALAISTELFQGGECDV